MSISISDRDYDTANPLKQCAISFKAQIDLIEPLSAHINNGDVHRYMAKVCIETPERKLGRALIYHKPSKGILKLAHNELTDGRVIRPLNALFRGNTEQATRLFKRANLHRPPGEDVAFHAHVRAAYQDGFAGYGAIIREDSDLLFEQGKSGRAEQGAFSGAMSAVHSILSWCQKNGVDQIAIHYEDNALALLCSGHYKAKTQNTTNFVQFVRSNDVSIIWVRADSEEEWQTRAQRQAVGSLPTA